MPRAHTPIFGSQVAAVLKARQQEELTSEPSTDAARRGPATGTDVTIPSFGDHGTPQRQRYRGFKKAQIMLADVLEELNALTIRDLHTRLVICRVTERLERIERWIDYAVEQ